MEDGDWWPPLAAWGAMLLVLTYLGLVRRVTGASRTAFSCRERGRAEEARRLPADGHPCINRPVHRTLLFFPPLDLQWNPRLSGFLLQLFVHLANSAFGQLFLVPLLIRLNNFTVLRYLDIAEDPTFMPVVAEEEKSDNSKSGNVSECLPELLKISSHSAGPSFSFKGIQDYLNCYQIEPTPFSVTMAGRKKSKLSILDCYLFPRSGELTPLQVAKNIIAALQDDEKSSLSIRAIVQWNQQEIIKMAEDSTARYKRKQPLSLLDGIPVCLKEEIKVVPYHHRSGTEYLGLEPESEDATVTIKLRKAGAIIIGASNMHELGIGTTGCNPNRFHGTARNPYNPHHFTGGSSSGSAAAVAAGLCPLALGTDGGGSVRIPASFCGIVGLKGTFGRISAFGCHPLSYSTVSLGPLCVSVADAAIAYAILAGPDPLYPYGLCQPKPSLSEVITSDLKGLKLGIDWNLFKACDAEILDACQKAVEFLKGFGASVVDLSLPEMEEVRVAHVICILSEMRDFLQPDFNNHFQQMYADDTQLYLLFSTNPGEAVAVMGWMRASKLKLNPDKTEVLLVGGSGFGEGDLDLVLNGVALPLRDKVLSLRVLLDPELSLEAQVAAVVRSAFFQLRLVHQLRPYLENDCLATVTNALVTSRLHFCNALYVGLPLKSVRMLQLVQNRAARLLTGTGRYVHMTPVLHQLHWLPIEVWAQFRVLVMTYEALNSLGPGYLKERLRPYMPARPLRSAGEALLREPSVKDIRRNLDTRLNLAIASQFSALDYIKANRQRSRTIAFLQEMFANVNCLLTPGTACCAPKIQGSDLLTGCSDVQTTIRTIRGFLAVSNLNNSSSSSLDPCRYMQLANLTGIPALVVPVGYTVSGLPISLQIMAKWWDEALLFRIGLKLEQLRNITAKPLIYYDILG
ncbi:Fatty acid amide hydrolase [Varanus komodoensis]|nr:Fatty acid amide hydrolase [Varanus komodoensis]